MDELRLQEVCEFCSGYMEEGYYQDPSNRNDF